MSMVRISSKDPSQTSALWDYLSQHGLHVVMLSPTQLEIECEQLPDELQREIASWQFAGDFEISSDEQLDYSLQSSQVAQPEPQPLQLDSEWNDDYVPEREFILAPYWRSVRGKASLFFLRLNAGQKISDLRSALSARRRGAQSALAARSQDAQGIFAAKSQQVTSFFATKRQGVQTVFSRGSAWLHETEERILAKSHASDEERQLAEQKAWAQTVQPRPAARVTFNPTLKLTDGGKAIAFAGGIVMAGVIGIGLSITHADSKPHIAATQSRASSAIKPATLTHTATTAQPQSKTQATPVQASLPHTVAVAKPSPVNSAGTSRKQRPAGALVAQRRNNDDEDDAPEVVTHYYTQKAVSQVHRTNYDVKHYSDIN